MKMLLKNFAAMAFDGEEQSTDAGGNLEELLTVSGYSKEDLEAFKTGKKSAVDVANAYVESKEKTMSERLMQKLTNEKLPELQAGVYAKVEKSLSETFGLDINDFPDKKNRVSAMLAEVKNKSAKQIKELEAKYSGADATKLAEAQKMIDQANAQNKEYEKQLKEMQKSHQLELQKQLIGFKVNQKKSNLVSGVVSNKAARYKAETVNHILNSEISAAGFGFDIEQGEEGKDRVFLTKDNVRVKNPNRPTEPYTLSAFVEDIAQKHDFYKKSNTDGSGAPPAAATAKGLENLSPEYLAYLQSRK